MEKLAVATFYLAVRYGFIQLGRTVECRACVLGYFADRLVAVRLAASAPFNYTAWTIPWASAM
jgi:hypothetical protein